MSDVEFWPLTGDPGALHALADRSSRAAASLRDAGDEVRRVTAALTGERSQAARSAQDRLADAVARLTTLASVLGSATATLHEHGRVLEHEQTAAHHALVRRDEALSRVRHHEAEQSLTGFTWNAPGAGTAAWAGSTAQALFAARADVAAAEADWRAARDAKRAASVTAAAALDALAEVRSVRAALGAGTPLAQFRASWLQGRHAADLLGPAAGAGGERTDRDRRREQLREQLLAHRDDPVFWQSFWDDATPQDLYLALGPHLLDPTDPPGPDLRQALGHGVLAWARTATADERTAFGASVVRDVGEWTGVEPRSELAAALLPPDAPAEVHDGAYDALAARWGELGHRPAGRDETAVLGVAVAAGLAAHPRLALDKLVPADGTRLARQSRTWFGWASRTGWPDGGTAVAGMFRAAVQAGSGSAHRGDQTRSAELASHAVADLPAGFLADPTATPTVSDTANARIAEALTPYVPAFSRATEGNLGTTDQEALEATGAEVPSPAIQPELDSFALRDVIASTSRTPAGADAWLSGAETLRDDVAERATSGRYDVDTAVRNDLGASYAHDVGMIAGSMESTDLRDARVRVAAQGALLDAAGFPTAFVRPAKSLAASAASTVVPPLLPDLVEVARQESLAAEPERRRFLLGPLHQAVVEHDASSTTPDGEPAWTAEEVEDRSVNLDPDDTAMCDSFGHTYRLTSDVRPGLGDKQCG